MFATIGCSARLGGVELRGGHGLDRAVRYPPSIHPVGRELVAVIDHHGHPPNVRVYRRRAETGAGVTEAHHDAAEMSAASHRRIAGALPGIGLGQEHALDAIVDRNGWITCVGIGVKANIRGGINRKTIRPLRAERKRVDAGNSGTALSIFFHPENRVRGAVWIGSAEPLPADAEG